MDHIEIMRPDGRVMFYDLDPVKGFTNIGRDPNNDIVIDHPDVAPFHAVIDHRQKPYHVTLFADGKPRPLASFDSLELNGHLLVFMEGAAPIAPPPNTPRLPVGSDDFSRPAPEVATASQSQDVPTPQPSASPGILPPLPSITSQQYPPSALEQLDALPPDRADDVVMVRTSAGAFSLAPGEAALEFNLAVEQTATFTVTVTNGGNLVAEFNLGVQGLDPSWVSISPAAVNLFEGQSATVNVAITAPRLPTSWAGPHYFSLVVASPTYPGRAAAVTGLINLQPYYQYALGDLSLRHQKISWRGRSGEVIHTIHNQGNSPAAFRVEAEDAEHACDFEVLAPGETVRQPRQADFTIAADQTVEVPIRITPRQRRFVGLGKTIPYTVTTTLLAEVGTPRTLSAQATSLPFIGPWLLLLSTLLLLIGIVVVTKPRVLSFKVNDDKKAVLIAGEQATLSWSVPPLTAVRIDPDVGPVRGSQGTVDVTPTGDVTYVISATNLLSRFAPRWFTAIDQVTVAVTPLPPEIISFGVDKSSVLVGEEVTVSWEVRHAEEMLLTRGDKRDTLTEPIGSRKFRLDQDTTFTLLVRNQYAPDGVSATAAVTTTTPIPTLPPPPVIVRFDVTPVEITQGEAVSISWEVTGATQVTITTLGDQPPSGSRTARPAQTTVYQLTAANGDQKALSREITVKVNPPPTATPLPGTPVIESFTAVPAEVAVNSPEAKNVTLNWKVSGDTTNIQITGPNFGTASGLPKEGSLKVNTEQATLFVLTAFNGSLSTSKTAQLKVVNPTPKIDSLTPSTSTEVGGAGFTLVVNGSGFTKDSRVRWEGSDRATTYVSSTQLNAAITQDDLAKAGTYNVTVFNPAPGGGTSSAAVFTLNNPTPSLLGLSPTLATKNGSGFTLTVSGANFINGSVVRFGGADMATSFLNSTQLTAIIPGSALTSVGAKAVTVFNPGPGGGTSGALNFTINDSNPKPTLNTTGTCAASTYGVCPNSATVNAADTTIIVRGSNFVQGSLARYNAIFLPTTFNSNSQLTATITSTLLMTATTANITVFNPTPGGGYSNSVPFTVSNPTIELCSTAGLPTCTTSATIGRGTTEASLLTVRFNVPLASAVITLTTSAPGIATVSPKYLQITNASSASVSITGQSLGTATITARLPDHMGGGTASATVAVQNPQPGPAITLNPDSKPAGSASFNLTLTGDRFVPGMMVAWNSVDHAPSSLSCPSTLLGCTATVIVPNTDITSAGTLAIAVKNPSPCDPSCTSNSANLTINAPTVANLSPPSGTTGGVEFTLTVTGNNFVSGSKVRWNNSERPTAFVSDSVLQATISASDLSTAGTKKIKVVNPGGSASNEVDFTVSNPTISLSPGALSIPRGNTDTVTVTISAAQSAARTVNLTSSDTTKATVQAAVTIPAGVTTANATVTAVAAGSANINATLVGVGNDAADTPVAVTVTKAATTTAVEAQPSNSVTGQSLTLVGHVFPKTQAGGTVTDGTVTITATDKNGANVTLPAGCAAAAVNSSGVATCSGVTAFKASLSPYTLRAHYNGGTNHQASAGGDETTASVTISMADTTTTALSSSVNPSAFGQGVTFSATVNITGPGGGTLGGNVVFKDGATTIATVAISGASGTTVTTPSISNLSVGNHTITAEYDDTSGNYNDSPASSSITQTVNPGTTTVTITSDDPDPSTTSQAVTVQFTVAIATGAGTPTGSATVTDGVSSCAAAITINGAGTYSCSLTLTTTGARTITVTYTSGDGNFTGNSDTEAHQVN